MTTAALYLRQSKTDDEGIERQRERTTALALARGWQVADEYLDNDVSASKPRGPKTAWGQMLADSDRFDVVVGVDLDRVVRSTQDINTLIDHGLMLATVDGEIDLTTADGEFRASMLASIAKFEVRRKGERQARANAQRASKGIPARGVRLTGYDTDMSVNDDEAVIVKRIFHEFLHSVSVYSIVKRLNEEGVPARGERWTPSTVVTILKNPKYAGRVVYKGVLQETRGAWVPLVTEDEFDAAQAIFSDPRRKTNREGTARKHIGSGIYRCAECFAPLKSAARTYSCVDCGMYRTIPHIDERVEKFMVKALSIPSLAPLLAPPVSPESEKLNAEAERLKLRLSVIESDYDSGNIDGARYRVASEKVRAELEAVNRARFEQVGNKTTGTILGAQNPAHAYLQAPLEVKRAVIDSLVTVRVKKAQRGRKGFDPKSVSIGFRNFVAKADGTANPTITPDAWEALDRLSSTQW